MTSVSNIAVSTALFGPENSKYVEYLSPYICMVDEQANIEEFDVVFHASPNLIPLVRRQFSFFAPLLTMRDRIHIIPLAEDGLNNLTASRQRFDYFMTTPQGKKYDAIALLDADDFPAGGYIKVMKNKMNEQNADIVVADFRIIYGSNAFELWRHLSWVIPDGEIKFSDVIDKNCMGLSNVLIKPHVLELGNYQRSSTFLEFMQGAPEWPHFLTAIGKGAIACFTSKTFVAYRQHGNLSGITRIDNEAIATAVRIKTRVYNDLAMEDLPADYHREAVRLAGVFSDMSRRFFDDEGWTLAFLDYANEQRFAARQKTLQFWEIAAEQKGPASPAPSPQHGLTVPAAE